MALREDERGWTQEFPKVDGCYWVRQPLHTPYLIEVTDGFAAFFGVERMAEATSFKPDHEFMPAFPSDFEQLVRLRELVVHMHVHSNYPNNGYLQMTTEQKALYDQIWNQSVAELDAEEAAYELAQRKKEQGS